MSRGVERTAIDQMIKAVGEITQKTTAALVGVNDLLTTTGGSPQVSDADKTKYLEALGGQKFSSLNDIRERLASLKTR